MKINGVTVHEGYIPTPKSQERTIERLLGAYQGSPEFSDYKALHSNGANKLSLPYQSVYRVCDVPNVFDDEAQTTGDCTSHGMRNGADISRAVEIDIKQEPEDFVARGATEFIYGYRGYASEGMNPGKATEACIKYGILVRQKYPFANLSVYNSSIGIAWGARGLPQAAKDEASKHPFRYFLRIRTVEEARDALASGFGIHCGSRFGTKGVRDSKGRCEWNSTWNHDMCWGGCDDGVVLTDDLYFVVINSWGPNWVRGPMPPYKPFPRGAFLINSRDAQRMINEGECWAIGNFQGFPLQSLPNYGFDWA